MGKKYILTEDLGNNEYKEVDKSSSQSYIKHSKEKHELNYKDKKFKIFVFR